MEYKEGDIFLGIDYGSKVIGLALYKYKIDPFPTPYGKIAFKSTELFYNELETILNDEVVDYIVFGLPLLTDGSETEKTKEHREVAAQLSNTFPNIPVILQDETLTTFEAEQRMLNSAQYNFKIDPKKIDSLSASIILEDFFKLL